jgi:glycerol-3-phosphate acyltransferase PlsX
MKIAVDAMGGDRAPGVVVEGAVMAARELGISIMLVGDKGRVEAELSKHMPAGDRARSLIEVRHSSEVVEMCEAPMQAVRKKKDSSIRRAFDAVKSGEANAVVSAGNSGAALAAGIFILKRLPGVDRPAIAVCVPTRKNPAVLLDVGGNVDCRPIHLVQFALMGDVYAKYALKIARPRIGLLSNGEEEGKGNELTRETNELLKKTSLNYMGYVEGRDIFHGDVDVVVADGFVGNVALKLSEGLVETVVGLLKDEIKSSFLSKVGYLLARGAFQRLKKKIDYAEYGGAPLLGIDGICMISHGGSSAKAIKNAIRRADEYSRGAVNEHMIDELGKNRDIERLMSAEGAV